MIIEGIEMIIGILIGVAYITLGERKIMGAMQRRKGPERQGIKGIIQPIIDGVKLMMKEIIIPTGVEKRYYIIGPIMTLILALIIWIPIPIEKRGGILIENRYSIIYILAISSITVYILIYTGWGSRSRYTIIGTIRAIGQLISYEVSIGIIIMNIIILNETYNIIEVIKEQRYIWNIIPLIPIMILLIISIIAETNRPPFDLSEAESELVAGVITEYGGIGFTYMYLAEYTFMLSMSTMTSILLLGNNLLIPIILYIYIWVRASLPRIRYDQLMNLGWTKILPISISYLFYILTLNILL